MSEKMSDTMATAVKQHGGLLRLEDAEGAVYYVLTSQQFQQYVYDDSELTADEMIAAAATGLGDPEGWGASGMNDYDQDDHEPIQ